MGEGSWWLGERDEKRAWERRHEEQRWDGHAWLRVGRLSFVGCFCRYLRAYSSVTCNMDMDMDMGTD